VSRVPLLAALLSLAVPAAAAPVAAVQNANGHATLLSSLSVLKKADMEFGELLVGGAGTAVIDPVSGTMTTTGGVAAVGSAAHAATFTGTGSKNSIVLIKLPKNPVTLTRVGGTETMSLSSWTLDGSNPRRIPANDVFDFAVGATLTVGAAQVEGDYVGTFAITVQYP
jgi:Domain of unknown function (DUF4402)